jgi:hypothetical protein
MGASLAVVRGKGLRSLIGRVLQAVAGETKPVVRRPISPFDKWGWDKATQAIDDAFDAQTIDISLHGDDSGASGTPGKAMFVPGRTVNPIVVNRKFFQGDHWQGGDGWIGPHPEITSSHFQDTMQEIANIFTSKNVIRECVMRHALGVVGRTMQWGFSPIEETDDPNGEPPEEIKRKIKEAMKIVRPWLQNRKVQTLLRDAICTLLLSERAGIQLTIPPGLADKDEDGNLVIEAASIQEALNFIYPEHPLPDNAAVISDRDTMMEAGIWKYTSGNDETSDTPTQGTGQPIIGDDAEKEYVAICFVDERNDTVIRVFEEDGIDPIMETELPMGGRIPMFEMRRAVLATLQVQQGQRALNLAESMIPRVSVTAGFLERLLTDIQLPGEPELDSEGNETGRWIEKPFYAGAGITGFLQSTEFMDEEGKVRRANGKVTYREPVAPTGAITASDKHYRSILDETGQLHVVMAGDSNPSGTSRLNARIEYLATLQLTQGEAEAAFRFIVDTALAMAEALSNKVGYFTSVIRTQVACRLDAGPLLPAERQAIEASIGKTISQETAMMLVGIEDVEAERARMAMDPLSRAAYGSAIGDALNKLTAPGATFEGAARFIGVEPDRVQLLLSGELGANVNPEPVGPGKDPKKVPEPPSPVKRGPGVGGPEKKPLPAPATSSSGTSAGGGLPISGAR